MAQFKDIVPVELINRADAILAVKTKLSVKVKFWRSGRLDTILEGALIHSSGALAPAKDTLEICKKV